MNQVKIKIKPFRHSVIAKKDISFNSNYSDALQFKTEAANPEEKKKIVLKKLDKNEQSKKEIVCRGLKINTQGLSNREDAAVKNSNSAGES